ncbi:MAG: hypothetical protein JSV52_00530 [Candidatus Zixiibacteriota bacterium]|nr:MAG: hypothetical protein JSV52_00530 [candidate division Zixibacteria bacterium]
MLSGPEKAYCAALLALKQKNYGAAVEHFESAAHHYRGNREFGILLETTRLLVAVKEQLARPMNHERLDIEEVFPNG